MHDLAAEIREGDEYHEDDGQYGEHRDADERQHERGEVKFPVRRVGDGFAEAVWFFALCRLAGGEEHVLHIGYVQRDGEDEHDDREEAHDEHLHGVVALNTQPEVLLLGAESEDADDVLHAPGHEVDDEARKAQKVQETLYYLTIAKLTEAHDDEGEFRLPRDRAQPGSLSHCCSPLCLSVPVVYEIVKMPS